MITVLHLITDLFTGGAEMMLYKLVARSDRARFRHVVVSMMDAGTLGERIEAHGIPVHTLGMRRGVPNPQAAIRFLALLRQESPDVLQTWLYHADLLGLLSALATQVPVVWNLRMSSYPGLKSPVGKLCASLSGLPAVVIANSEVGRAVHARSGYRPRRWKVIPNGFDVEQFAPDSQARAAVRRELGLPADTVLIGMVARFDPQKDHQNFLRAAALFNQHDPAPHFLLVGSRITLENTLLKRVIDAAGLGERVHLLGERRDIPRLTAALDVATLSSAYGEGFPGVVCEAMACAVPCVVTDVGDAASMVGDTGRVVPPQEPSALAAAWQGLLGLGLEERARLGQRARHRVKTLFSLDHIVRQYEEVYEHVVSTRPPEHVVS